MIHTKRDINDVIDKLLRAKGDEIRAEILFANHQLDRKEYNDVMDRLDAAVVAAECIILGMLQKECDHAQAVCDRRRVKDMEGMAEVMKTFNDRLVKTLDAIKGG